MGAQIPDEHASPGFFKMTLALRRAAPTFTVDQANATLPLVRAITKDLMVLSRDLAERRLRLAELVGGRKLRHGDPYADELLESKKEIDKDLERLQGFFGELLELGVEPKSALEGLIDFPSRLDGCEVYSVLEAGGTGSHCTGTSGMPDLPGGSRCLWWPPPE